MTDHRTPAERIADIAATAGVEMVATFVPFSKSPNANARPDAPDGKPWRSLNWNVRLTRDGRDILETPYGQGLAWTPAYKAPVRTHGNANSLSRERAILMEIEEGRTATPSVAGADTFSPGAALPAPSIVEILTSLAIDASAIDYPTFESWAEDYGFNVDSRSAEASYRACLQTALALRAAFGDEGLSALRDAAADA